MILWVGDEHSVIFVVEKWRYLCGFDFEGCFVNNVVNLYLFLRVNG